ncbi:DUF4169 family protein [Altererythrobacter xixiisoli]|uniref:DUF4169 family protein n=1 Tax=Croceibacterium xixiisoli TaxID=1476466 RepID=A0A6I4TVS2_9SPHN|nr:DUF4169 family protein [Croceibacterium xixiisoli]MXO98897.1 DUF4169 family protein [Croceibacterium xixiisoli]
MAEIVNLRQARKAAKRAGEEAQAAANRARFGQTKSGKASVKAEAERILRTLDGAQLEGAAKSDRIVSLIAREPGEG